MSNLSYYNKFFEDDDDDVDDLPCSQMANNQKIDNHPSDTQVLQSLNPNVLKQSQCLNKEKLSITSKIVNQKLAPIKKTYRGSQVSSSTISSENSSINSSTNSIEMRSPQMVNENTQIEDNTQIKRMKFFETMLDSTNKEPPRQVNLDDSIDDLVLRRDRVECTNFFDLPNKVKDLLKTLRGITNLYEWQNDLLVEMSRREKCQNLLYLSPTSGGKTLVAEILLLQCLLLRKKSVIFVMPFVSIVQEKVETLIPFGEHLDFFVEEYAGLKGMIPPTKRIKGKTSLFICTIEKAQSLLNSLIETDRLDEIGMVVADELHMIGDGPRGAIYEMILSKAKFCGKKHNLQIVATTATLENKQEIASFLDAYLYERHFRPVELKEFIKLEKQVFNIDKEMMKKCDENDFSYVSFIRELDTVYYTNDMKKSDPDGLIAIINEIFDVSSEEAVRESCLIFCPTKKNCENVAQLLAKFLPKDFKKYKKGLKLKLFSELKEQNGNNICPVLRESLQFGIAYHHSGLTTEERQLIEAAYREGVLFLLTCTSTLAAGVNLPAKRVIIRAPYVGRDFISSHQYKQMIGRAGRAGFNTCGESILFFQNIDRYKVYDLVSGPMKRCESSIEFDSKAIRLLVLSLIGLKVAENGFEILKFFKETLFYLQKKEIMTAKLSQTFAIDDQVPSEFAIFTHGLSYLLSNNLIQIKTEDEPSAQKQREYDLKELYFAKYDVTKLGMAAIKGGIDLDSTQQLFNDLDDGLKSMVLSNYLHLLYLCTPYELANNLLRIDFDVYARKFSYLSSDEMKCAEIIGVSEDFINKKRFQSKINNKNMNEDVLKRFYLTLIIYELWKNNKSIWHVSNEFQLDRGFVQQIIQSSASFTSGVLHFCENLDEFWPYKNLLQDLMKRLQYNCSQTELLEIMELDNVRLPRAQQLFNAGYSSIELIAKADPKVLSDNIKNMPLPAATKLVKSANRILKDKIDLLQSEADNLLMALKI